MSRRAVQKRRAGFSLLDAVIAITIMTVAVGGLCASVIASMQLARVNEEKATAVDAAHAMAERLQGMPFDEIFATYNSYGADDPGGPNTAPGNDFAVPALSAQDGDADGFAGRIEFQTGAGKPGKPSLREDLDDPGLGLPRDLNGDGAIDSLDHSGDYVLLPVRVRVSWRGAGGNQTTVLETLLVE